MPKNTYDLVQPVDEFVVQKIKDAWNRRWDAWKLTLVRAGNWTERSGKLPNSGKYIYL